MDRNPKQLPPGRQRLVNWLNNYIDVKSSAKFFPTLFLLGVSLVVVYHMEETYSNFKGHTRKSITEREYFQKAAYEDIMNSINEFDGQNVPLRPQDQEEEMVYRYERKP